MTERLVADAATTRLINWLLGVGSVVTGGLLLWIGSTTYELAKEQAVTSERLQSVQAAQTQTNSAVRDTAGAVRDLSLRVQRVEDGIQRDRETRERE